MPGDESRSRPTRRRLLGAGMACLAVTGLAARAALIEEGAPMAGRMGIGDDPGQAERGRLMAQPGTVGASAPVGLRPLGLGGKRDGLLYVPSGYRPDRPAPLVVMLHGAGGHARDAMEPLRRLADAAGFLLLAPDSRATTWDVIVGGFGPDVEFLGRALASVFRDYSVDPKRVAVAGFSDGASYALTLGVGNGDLFTHVIAFAPGFMAPAELNGKPRLFLSHGTKDAVLPIDRCSRKLVPQLRRAGYDVTYREFDGPHTVPADIAIESVAWFDSPPAPANARPRTGLTGAELSPESPGR